MILSVLALLILLLLVACVILLAAWLGGLPGRIARERSHPQADAINACGWLGLITMGVPWLIAMVWAYTNTSAPGTVAALADRVAQLENTIDRLAGKEATS